MIEIINKRLLKKEITPYKIAIMNNVPHNKMYAILRRYDMNSFSLVTLTKFNDKFSDLKLI